LLTATAITPLNRGEVDHPATHKHQKEGRQDGQHVVERESTQENVTHVQKLIVPSPLRPHTTMAIEKVKTAHRAAQPTVISMVLQQMWRHFNQRRGADWAS
jgi:hypothetical protein